MSCEHNVDHDRFLLLIDQDAKRFERRRNIALRNRLGELEHVSFTGINDVFFHELCCDGLAICNRERKLFERPVEQCAIGADAVHKDIDRFRGKLEIFGEN